MNNIPRFFISALILSMLSPPLYAGDVFVVNAVTTDRGSPINLAVGDSNFSNLLQNTIEANGQFAVLDDRGSISILNYGGVSDAMRFDINTAGTQATLNIPILSFNKTFIGANRDDLYNQIKDFLRNEGADVYRRFLEAMNRKSLVAVIDGNPNSITAITARSIFEDAGFGGDEAMAKAVGLENLNFSLMVSIGQFNTNNLQGQSYTLPLGFSYKFTDQVSTKISMPLTYWTVNGAHIYDGGFIVNVPVKILLPAENEDTGGAASSWVSKLGWTLTPSLGMAAGGSQDYSAGSVMYVGGLTSMLSYDFGRFSLTMGNSLSAMEGLNVGNFNVGSNVNQQILKNGLKLTVPFNGKWVGETYGIYTAFLQEAAVSNFFTVGAQVGMRLYGDGSGASGLFMLGVVGDIASNYTSFSVRFGSGFRF